MQIKDDDNYDPIVEERSIEYDGFKATARIETDRVTGAQFVSVLDDCHELLYTIFGNQDHPITDNILRVTIKAYVMGRRDGVSYGRSDVRTAIVRALGL